MQSTRLWPVCSFLVSLLFIAGCGRDSASSIPPGPPRRSNPPAADAPAPSNTPTSSNNTRSGNAARPTDASQTSGDPAAQSVFAALVHAYQNATAYSDQARVVLSYQRNGEAFRDEAPLRVNFRRDDAIRVAAYAANLLIEGGTLQATITDPITQNFGQQILTRDLNSPPITLANIYGDPAWTQFATSGLGGPAPQLELLLAESPLAGLFANPASVTLDPPDALEGRPCNRLRVEADGLVYRFWIDTESHLLRRVDLPTEPTGLNEDPSIESVSLAIELTDATFTPGPKTNWNLETPPLGPRVSYFVPPPPPIASPVLGKTPAPFELRTSDDTLRVTHTGSDRDFTVMLWIANHPASRAAAETLQKITGSLPAEILDRTRFLVVMAEPETDSPNASQTMLRNWNVGLPVADDSQAVGRDVFQIRTAPTIAIIGRQGTLEWFQPRVGPEMTTSLPALLRDLAAGQNVGSALRSQYDADQETYRQLLQQAGRPRAEALPPGAPDANLP